MLRKATAILFLAIFFLSIAVVNAEARPIVAVFDIENQGVKLPSITWERLNNYLGSLMAERGFQIVPRAQIKARLSQEKKQSYRQCYDETCQIDLGKELSAQKSLASSVILLGGECKVTLTLYDLKKATSEAGKTVSGKCDEAGIVKSLEEAVRQLVAFEGPSSAAATAQPVTAIPPQVVESPKGGEGILDTDMGVIDLQKALDRHPDAPTAKAQLAKMFNEAQAELDRAQEEIKQSKSEREKTNKFAAVQKLYKDRQQELNKTEGELTKKIYTAIRDELSRLAKPTGVQLFVDSKVVLVHEPQLDCTDLVFGTAGQGCSGVKELLVGFVDKQRLLTESEMGSELIAQTKWDFVTRHDAISKKKIEIEAAQIRLQDASPTERPALENKLREESADLEQRNQKLEKEMAQAEASALERVEEAMKPRFEEMARARGFSLVLDASAAIHFVPAANCTDAFLGKGGASCAGVRGDRIRMADVQALLSNSKQGKQAKKLLKEKFDALQRQIDEKQRAFNQAKATLPPQKAQEESAVIQALLSKSQKELSDQEANITIELLAKVKPIAGEVAQLDSADAVLNSENIPFGLPVRDVTSKLVLAMDRTYP